MYTQRRLGAGWACALALLLLLLLCKCAAGADAAAPKCFPTIFNFGDSNSDTGGLGAAFGAPPLPNGITTFHKPSGRFCDGRLLIDFVDTDRSFLRYFRLAQFAAEELGLPYLDAYLQSVGSNFERGANFATAGSTIRLQNTTLAQSGFSPFSLGVQVSQFVEFKQRTLTYHSQEPFTRLLPQPHDLEEALYVVDIGQNDLTAGYFLNLTLQQVRAYIPQVIAEFGDYVKALNEHGAKYFMIITTGPVGCLPYILVRLPYTQAEVDKQGCAEPYNKVARIFNRKLMAKLHQLQVQLVNTTFVMVDGYNLKLSMHGKSMLWVWRGAFQLQSLLRLLWIQAKYSKQQQAKLDVQLVSRSVGLSQLGWHSLYRSCQSFCGQTTLLRQIHHPYLLLWPFL